MHKSGGKTSFNKNPGMRGFSTTELVVVVLIILIVAAIAIPNTMQAWYNMELRATGDQVASLMQQARILAAKNNSYYTVCYQTTAGVQQVYLTQTTLASTTSCSYAGGTTPIIALARQISAASAAPTTPAPYTYSLDSTSGTPCDNTCRLAFSPRGLPCKWDSSSSPAVCTAPAASYFVYYFQDSRPNGWSAVLVSKAARTKTLIWNGSAWE